MTRRRKRTPFGNHWITVILWAVFNVVWFAACILATIWLARILALLVWLALGADPDTLNGTP